LALHSYGNGTQINTDEKVAGASLLPSIEIVSRDADTTLKIVSNSLTPLLFIHY